MHSLSLRDRIDRDGFAIVPAIISQDQAAELISILENLENSDSIRRRGGVFAVRNLLDVSPEVKQLARAEKIRELVAAVLFGEALPVRGILFDKTPDANWKVPWHQDLTIAVAQRIEVDGFGPWSTKAGVLHVQPPASVLEEMVSIRIHLDRCGEENGALRVLAGSHKRGRIPEAEAARLGAEGTAVICAADVGDALLMRPLLLHASSASSVPQHRRVIHVDFAVCELPCGLRWAEESAEV